MSYYITEPYQNNFSFNTHVLTIINNRPMTLDQCKHYFTRYFKDCSYYTHIQVINPPTELVYIQISHKTILQLKCNKSAPQHARYYKPAYIIGYASSGAAWMSHISIIFEYTIPSLTNLCASVVNQDEPYLPTELQQLCRFYRVTNYLAKKINNFGPHMIYKITISTDRFEVLRHRDNGPPITFTLNIQDTTN